MSNSAVHNEITCSTGDTITVYYRITEKIKKAGKTKKSVTTETKTRIQPFTGTLISVKGTNENKSITVRRTGADNIGIERVFPLSSPWVTKIEVVKKNNAKRAKLYYLRNASHAHTVQ